MPLLRAGSAMSTFSLMERRATKYQKFLNLSNVFLLITSTILIFSAVILMKFYHVDKLSFWSSYFSLVPMFMIVLGVYTFIVTVFGFLISGSERRSLLAVYAVLLAIAFIAQLVSIFTALELRNTITQANYGSSASEELSVYGKNSSVTSKWDSMHQDLNCCGATGFNLGYTNWRTTPFAQQGAVPDSCCHVQSPGCGKGVLNLQEASVRNKIFVHGCVTVLEKKLTDDVIPMMIVYACVGVLLAIVELITVVLASAYIAQITRKIRREEKMHNDNLWRRGDADHNNDQPDAGDPLKPNHETMC